MREDVAVHERIAHFKRKPRYDKRELRIAKEALGKVAAAGVPRTRGAARFTMSLL